MLESQSILSAVLFILVALLVVVRKPVFQKVSSESLPQLQPESEENRRKRQETAKKERQRGLEELVTLMQHPEAPLATVWAESVHGNVKPFLIGRLLGMFYAVRRAYVSRNHDEIFNLSTGGIGVVILDKDLKDHLHRLANEVSSAMLDVLKHPISAQSSMQAAPLPSWGVLWLADRFAAVKVLQDALPFLNSDQIPNAEEVRELLRQSVKEEMPDLRYDLVSHQDQRRVGRAALRVRTFWAYGFAREIELCEQERTQILRFEAPAA